MKHLRPKENRDRIFRKGKPYVRQFDMARDFWVMWAAYDLGSFPKIPKGLTKEDFAQFLMAAISPHSSAIIIEDDCKWFKEKRGPICMVLIDNFGWRIEPFADFFFWATPRLRLRAIVSFLHMVRYDDVGVCLARVPEKHAKFYDRLHEYGIMFRCGKIPFGTEEGPEHLFYVHGKKKAVKFDPLEIARAA